MPALQTAPPYWLAHTHLVRNSLADLPTDVPLVLVGHSGAGPLLPLLAQQLDPTVAGFIYVDAGLPHIGPWLAGAPPDFARRLETLVVDGMLPKWTDWWDPADLAAELPDPEQRTAIADTLEPLPFAMFTEDRPDPSTWRMLPSAYLQLSAGYAGDAAAARSLGWPTQTLNSTHLGLITEPNWVAAGIGTLMLQLTEEEPDDPR